MKILRISLAFLYQVIRPLLGPAYCKFPISCGEFALQKIHEKPLFIALWIIFKRVISCNPFFSLPGVT